MGFGTVGIAMAISSVLILWGYARSLLADDNKAIAASA
jgi:hypothetical protein